jgi:hypothetical protein
VEWTNVTMETLCDILTDPSQGWKEITVSFRGKYIIPVSLVSENMN